MEIIQYCLIITVVLMGKCFEYLERKSPDLFWALTLGLATIFSSFDKNSLIQNSISIPHQTEKICLNVRGGSDSKEPIVTIRTGLGKKIKINIITHRWLEKFFPDWKERMAYQENREKVYKSAMSKRQNALRLRLKEDFSRTKDEQDAIDYFSGEGVYRTFQNPTEKPNIFHNRQSFLLKMHNKEMRMNFVKSFNRWYTLMP